MKINELRKTVRLIDECDKLLDMSNDRSLLYTDSPGWLLDDMKRCIEVRRQNLIEILQRRGVDVDA